MRSGVFQPNPGTLRTRELRAETADLFDAAWPTPAQRATRRSSGSLPFAIAQPSTSRPLVRVLDCREPVVDETGIAEAGTRAPTAQLTFERLSVIRERNLSRFSGMRSPPRRAMVTLGLYL